MSEHQDRLRLLEALLFAAAEPLAEDELARRLGDSADVPVLLRALAEGYAERGVNLVRLAGGWTFRTAPDLAAELRSERSVSRKLSRAAVETLAIVAYHQPVTRAEIETIRGVGYRISEGELIALFLSQSVLRHCHGTPYEPDLRRALARLAASEVIDAA